ncbi:MAG: transcription termination factor NusA [Planctomycetes bacterium]|nr:transcription termination factor NusA [Planctomycetota bacterium]
MASATLVWGLAPHLFFRLLKTHPMRKDDVLRLIDAIHRERGVDREILFHALEEALSLSVRKKLGVEEGYEVIVNRKDGSTRVIGPEGGDEGVELPSAEELGRIAAQTFKQVFMQKIREAERDKVFAEYADLVGTIVAVKVEKLEGPNMFLSLPDGQEAVLTRAERVQSERLHIGDRIRVLVTDIVKRGSRVEIQVSRKSKDFVEKLFAVEIPEVADGNIKVMKVARDPGYRTKIAVYSPNDNIDVVGACLGVRGSRIRNVNDELRNEKIDIIAWSSSLEELVVNALKPAKNILVDHVFPDENTNSVLVLVAEDQKPLAIGMGGRNVRLASEIVGWSMDLKTPTEYEQELMASGNVDDFVEEEPGSATEDSVSEEA